jgi:CubicO group peptidase (beta-lactamase class C family)
MRFARVILALFSSVLCLPMMHAQDAAPVTDSPKAKVDELFRGMDTTVTPGCALSVMKDGKIIYERGYGMADLDHNVPITPSTVFHVASMSKQFTAASIVMLAQEGKLSLDDPVRKYIPELPDFGVPVTIRELIHHTSGLRDQWDLLGLWGWRYSRDLITDNDVLAVISRQTELNFPPNTRHLYSNTGYTLLAQIVKRVSGESFRQFTTERIFQPLGMTSTHFRDDHAEIVKNMAYGYDPEKDTFKISITNFDTVGATSLLTTVEDLAKWDENFYAPRVGGDAMVKQMLERGKLNSGEQLDYAFGLVIGTDRGLKTVDHGGADAGYRSDMIRFPDQHFSVACLCNAANANPSDLARKVAEIYLDKEMKPAETAHSDDDKGVELTPEQMQSKTGLYVKKEQDDVLVFQVKDGKLRVSNGSDETTYELKARDADHLRLAGAPVDFDFAAPKAGGPLEMTLKDSGGKPEVYERVDAFTPTAADLSAYAGVYSSDEIDPLYRIKVEDGALVLHRLKNRPDKLMPVTAELFIGSIGTLRFSRDAKNKVSGFKLSTGRIQNLRFVKGRAAIPAE